MEENQNGKKRNLENREEKPEGLPSEQKRTEPEAAGEAEPHSELEALKAKVTELEESVEFFKDQLLRKAADFENFKKRTENDYVNFTRFANEDVITELLPILDDLTRSLKAGRERREFGPFYKGIELIHSKLMKTLEALGLKPIEAVGQQFNVDYHEALMQMLKENVPPHTIIEEVQKGYLLHDKVIRHSKVIVAGNSEEPRREISEPKDETNKGDESSEKETQ